MPLLLLLPLLLLFVATVRLVGPVIRWTFRIGVALAAALFAAAVLPLTGQGWVPLAVFVAVLALLARRPERRAAIGRTRLGSFRPSAIAGPPTTPTPEWPQLRRLADWGTRRRLDAAHEACERYLLLAETEEDPGAQLPIRLRRHLPALVDDCVRHCRTATRDEQRTLVAQTLTSVETIAAQAEARRRELAHLAQTGFRARQAHLARGGD
ncbi:hypothetical protein [uncultured Sphingomonas sp.]|uniref:hypothetical protein n=1 Tax=uncultured Sphingomonas sp. TaxID=158754 RepID=UPI0035C9FCAC